MLVKKNDKLINFYELIPKDLMKKPKKDKNYEDYRIEPCSHILAIGGTGTGKTNFLCNFMKRKKTWCKIVIFTGSSGDEPLYNFIKKEIPSAEIINKIEDLPDASSFDNQYKEKEKLFIFDDFIAMKPNDLKKLDDYAIYGRKYGITTVFMSQNYVKVPKTIVRNVNYFVLFRINDNISINNIIKNHNLYDVPKDVFKNMYLTSTKDRGNFFMIDLTIGSKHPFRMNFLNDFVV
jgi:hypothetical protein